MRPVAVAFSLLVASLFASSAEATERRDEPRYRAAESTSAVVELVHVARGVAATGAQLGSYGLCYLALGSEDTCITIAGRAFRAVTRVR